MAERAAKLVRFEIGQIDELLARYEAVLTKVRHNEPDLIELTALASVLHSFFTGVENIFFADDAVKFRKERGSLIGISRRTG